MKTTITSFIRFVLIFTAVWIAGFVYFGYGQCLPISVLKVQAINKGATCNGTLVSVLQTDLSIPAHSGQCYAIFINGQRFFDCSKSVGYFDNESSLGLQCTQILGGIQPLEDFYIQVISYQYLDGLGGSCPGPIYHYQVPAGFVASCPSGITKKTHK